MGPSDPPAWREKNPDIATDPRPTRPASTQIADHRADHRHRHPVGARVVQACASSSARNSRAIAPSTATTPGPRGMPPDRRRSDASDATGHRRDLQRRKNKNKRPAEGQQHLLIYSLPGHDTPQAADRTTGGVKTAATTPAHITGGKKPSMICMANASCGTMISRTAAASPMQLLRRFHLIRTPPPTVC